MCVVDLMFRTPRLGVDVETGLGLQ